MYPVTPVLGPSQRLSGSGTYATHMNILGAIVSQDVAELVFLVSVWRRDGFLRKVVLQKELIRNAIAFKRLGVPAFGYIPSFFHFIPANR